jgi:exodeoxyribonuclease X
MIISLERPVHFRVLDVETTGLGPDDAVVEIGAVDLVDDQVVIVGSDLVRPPISIPPQASAVHHITDNDVGQCRLLGEVLPFYLDQSGAAGVDVFASHNWRFET